MSVVREPKVIRIWTVVLYCGCFLAQAAAQVPQTRPIDGLRVHLPQVHALVGAKIVVSADQTIERGVVVVRDGVIEQVGLESSVKIPTDARTWNVSGRIIYPGLVDPYSELEVADLPADRGAPHWSRLVQPEREVQAFWNADAGAQDAFRKQGIAIRLVAPTSGILKGQSAVFDTGDNQSAHHRLHATLGLHVRLTSARGGRFDEFPWSPMGAVALARQTFYDANWYREAWKTMESRGGVGLSPPERNQALESLGPYLDGKQPVIFDALDEQYFLRADAFAREFGLRAWMLGSGREYQRLEEIRKTQRPVILPIAFPSPPNVSTPEGAADVSLEALMHWDLAPENPARLHQAGIHFALTSFGQKNPGDYWPALRKAVRRGLPADAALRAVTQTPAEWLQVDHQAGTVQVGKFAHLIVASGDLFASDEAKIVETWVHGRRYEFEKTASQDLRGQWTFETSDGVTRPDLKLSGEPTALKAEFVGKEKTETSAEQPAVELRNLNWSNRQLSADFAATTWGGIGAARLTMVFIEGRDITADRFLGEVIMPDGKSLVVTARRKENPAPEPATAPKPEEANAAPNTNTNGNAQPTPVAAAASGEGSSDKDASTKATDEAERIKRQMASFPTNYPLGDFGRKEPPAQPAWLLFRQATVWTCAEAGIMTQADVLVHQGLIARVVPELPRQEWPEGVVVIEAKGLHLTPGIIDCHSHMATDGGVNEPTQAVTAEVRISDFIDARDVTIYRQLAGGVTAANILHGSANPIGGQNQVIKLRWGASPDEMKFAEAPAGIKWALGENVKQSNRGGSSRYPQTRMGVEQIMRDALLAARQYRDQHLRWKDRREGLPPRRDLELDALVEVLEGKRFVHCHSYRQDEILALLRSMESLGVQVATLQHILEGYKVADAIKQHGAMASSFSDWWAYKMEVYDAIPFNGALMHQQGIVVSFNSDDGELARHLNQEAGKAMKYGGVSADEAMRFVTLNPAKQLRVDSLVGSIEPGKHADLVLWSDEPLSPMARCQQTWIDGRKYFDFDEDRAQRSTWQSMRETLIQKVLNSGETPVDPAAAGQGSQAPRDDWPRYDWFCPMSRP